MKNKFLLLFLCAVTAGLWAQGIRERPENESRIPLKRVVILASGLAYYEHSGMLDGAVSMSFPFRLEAINDALKSLVINDSSSTNPSVIYQSEHTLLHTLRSLKIDLSDDPDFAVILSRLRGTEVVIASPTPYTGRITGIEYRQNNNPGINNETWLILSTTEGIKQFKLEEISSIKFTDSDIERDLSRALDLIAASRNSMSRQLLVNLPGRGRRNVSISYVIPSPVWKVSYRLDLSTEKPLFQGWAIVDNDSDSDWNNVELSLVAGRPSSFIQNLYPPYYVSRPVLPLAIAGTAEAAVHDRSAPALAAAPGVSARARSQFAYDDMAEAELMTDRQSTNLAGGVMETAAGSEAGGQFEFIIKNPVSLDRRMSAMLPLVESPIEARSLLIYNGRGRHPRLGAEIKNTSGMKLPAGPITVYDGGVYAGDALIEFWNEGEKRLISFGEDLSITADASNTNTQEVSSVSISGGVMTINRNSTFIRTYTFINSASISKLLVVEHAKTANTTLVSPQAADQTTTAYHFHVTLPANRQTSLTVREQRPVMERITLLSMRPDAFLSYSTNTEIPSNVRQALQRAVELRRAADTADIAVKDIESQRDRLTADQDRIRRNIEAAGNQTQQGQEYLRRLAALDSEIDVMTVNLERANVNARTAREALEIYLTTLNL